MVRKANMIRYEDMVTLYLCGSVLGVVIEGIYCLFRQGRWETHVVSLIGPFNIIYGLGAVGFYIVNLYLKDKHILIRILAFSLIGTAIEFVSGYLLERGLNMYAWDYSRAFGNYRGYICPSMSAVWGIAGVAFERLIPLFDSLFQKMHGQIWTYLAIALSVIIIIDLLMTAVAIVRWSRRHVQIMTVSPISAIIDRLFGDEYMKNRFCEWRFLDER